MREKAAKPAISDEAVIAAVLLDELCGEGDALGPCPLSQAQQIASAIVSALSRPDRVAILAGIASGLSIAQANEAQFLKNLVAKKCSTKVSAR